MHEGSKEAVPLSYLSARKIAWTDFITLTKPGILRSNLVAALSGFWIASRWEIDWMLLIWTMLGTLLVMASSCVFNNYLDRDFDIKMERTRRRPLPAGRLHPTIVFWYGVVLGLLGLLVFIAFTNWVTVVCAVIGMFFYIVVYTVWLKRTSTWSTSVGGVSGAMPPVIGYVAVTGTIDAGAILLFAILFLWQPPHFWALGIRRKEEYRAAGFPLLPVVKGVRRTQWQMVPYVALLIPAGILMYVYGYVNMFFPIASTILGLIWLYICVRGLTGMDETKWAKQAFLFSIQYLVLINLLMIICTGRG